MNVKCDEGGLKEKILLTLRNGVNGIKRNWIEMLEYVLAGIFTVVLVLVIIGETYEKTGYVGTW